jgi:O-antigen/teichoic acid export membrane protein
MVDAIEKKGNQRTPEPLSKTVVKGGMWVFALRIINRGLGLVRTIVLARLLAPEDFGLMGIAMLSIATLETFSQTGFQVALIQKKENVQPYLDTAWTVSAIRGTMLFIILFLSAPLIARFFNSPEANLVIKVIAISTLVAGFRNIGIVFFQKEMKFNKQFLYEISGTLVDLSVAITLAFILRDVWALVWGSLAGNLIRFFMSYVVQPYRPRISLEKNKIRDLFGFGRWVLGSSILVFLITQGDDIFVGKLLGLASLGYYQMAYVLSNLPTTEITHVISQVTFPAYSYLQDDVLKLKAAYLKVLQLTAFISIPLAGGILVVASDFTEIFLGLKWMPMVPAIQVLAMAGLIRSIAATTGPIFHAIGRPRIDTFWQIIRLGILALLIYPFSTNWGILGTSIAVLLSISVSTVGFSFEVVKITNCGKETFLKMILLPLLNTIIMMLALLLIKNIYVINSASIFIFHILVGIFTYFIVSIIFDKILNYGIHAVLKDSLASF